MVNKNDINESTVDFSKCTVDQLSEGLRFINPAKFPANYEALILEIEKRTSQGDWSPHVHSTVEKWETCPVPSDAQEFNFKFIGSGREYFQIWITNFLLCLLTLGLFTPWAKVRAKRYFYSRTILGQCSFSYTGDPWRILSGRLILVVLILLLFLSDVLFFVSVKTFLICIIFLGPIIPFVIWKSAIFNFSNSSHRGISFSMGFKLSEVYSWFFITLFKIIFTLGIYSLTLSYQYRAFVISHLRFGQTKFHHKISQIAVLKKVLPLAFLLGFVSVGISWLASVVAPATVPLIDDTVSWLNLIVFFGISDAISTDYICDHLQLDSIRFRSNINKWELIQLYLKAGILTLISLGLAWPWVRIQIIRYKLENIKIHASAEVLEGFKQDNQQREKSAGGFASEFLEFDFGI